MGVLDRELSEVEVRFKISGSAANALLSDLLSFINSEDGGVFGFIERLRRAGLRGWLLPCVRGDATPFDPVNVTRAMGKRTVKRFASRSVLSFSEAAVAIGFLLPKIFQKLVEVENGMLPSILPSQLTVYISGPTATVTSQHEATYRSSIAVQSKRLSAVLLGIIRLLGSR